jgi:mitochondrial enoyl-[acyl-carrier protein] reductase / trans-2-enoyl-CoA reductase
VQWTCAPINPSDVNMIQGVYPVTPRLAALEIAAPQGEASKELEASGKAWLPGAEGVGRVVWVGPEVGDCPHSSGTPWRIGDRVLPITGPLGTWRSLAILKPSEVLRVEALAAVPAPAHVSATPLPALNVAGIPDLHLASLSVNPCTAYRMLHDFVPLAVGTAILQNAANSAVGQAVIQLAHAMGVRTINICRDRPDFEALETHLKGLGADLVVREEELEKSGAVVEMIKSLAPGLALNGVGGKSATNLARLLK